jgi:hypothetical protein
MKEVRKGLRKKYIEQGLMLDPTQQVHLEKAIDLKGTCVDLCPEFERHEREYQKLLDKMEVVMNCESLILDGAHLLS